MQASVISPERLLVSAEADMVVARSTEGEIAFCPGHVPFLGILQPGIVKIVCSDKTEKKVLVHSGFVDVMENELVILTDIAENLDEIDKERALNFKRQAEEMLAKDPDNIEAAESLKRAERRLAVVDGRELP